MHAACEHSTVRFKPIDHGSTRIETELNPCLSVQSVVKQFRGFSSVAAEPRQVIRGQISQQRRLVNPRLARLKRPRLRFELRKRESEPGQQFRANEFHPEPARVQPIGALGQREYFNQLRIGIDDPVFRYAELFIKRLLVHTVSPPRALGNHFTSKFGTPRIQAFSTIERLATETCTTSGCTAFRVLKTTSMGLTKSFAQLPRPNVFIEQPPGVGNNALVDGSGRGGHDDFPIPQFRGQIRLRQLGRHFVVLGRS